MDKREKKHFEEFIKKLNKEENKDKKWKTNKENIKKLAEKIRDDYEKEFDDKNVFYVGSKIEVSKREDRLSIYVFRGKQMDSISISKNAKKGQCKFILIDFFDKIYE